MVGGMDTPEVATSKISMNFDSALLAEIDARAKDVGLNRTEWITRCTRWAIHNLPFGADGPTRRRVALAAPKEVAGIASVDMGLDGIEGK